MTFCQPKKARSFHPWALYGHGRTTCHRFLGYHISYSSSRYFRGLLNSWLRKTKGMPSSAWQPPSRPHTVPGGLGCGQSAGLRSLQT